MKNMKPRILGSAAVLSLLVGGTIASATQTIDGREGQTSGDVQVNGIIGSFDNTKPGPDPEDINEWINVTIPTTALFYSTEASAHKELVSPTYTVTNNSAKGVITTVSSVKDASTIESVDLLNINAIELIKEGKVSLTESELFELGASATDSATKTFEFTGTSTPGADDEEINPSFNLVLNFAPVVE